MPHLPCGPGFSRPTHRVRLKPDLHGARRVFAVAATFLALAHAAHADPAPAAQAEIDHLLAFVAASACSFVRSGKPYPAAEARDHLAGKFQYAKSRISTADEFIRYIATESSMTREPYKVNAEPAKCPRASGSPPNCSATEAAATRPAR